MLRIPSLLFACPALLLAAACSGTVQSESSGSTGAGGATATSASAASGAGAATTASSSATSSATAGATSASSAAAASSASSSGAGGGACAGFVDLVVDGAGAQHLTSNCADAQDAKASVGPAGYAVEGGPPPGIELIQILGCVTLAANSEGIELSADGAMTPGTYGSGAASYTDAMGLVWNMPVGTHEVVITALGAVGEPIDGTFFATVTAGGQGEHKITGSFHVCRGPDVEVP